MFRAYPHIALRVLSQTRRALLLILVVVALAPSAGCTTFQRITTANWFDDSPQVNQMMARWENRVFITENSQNGGTPLPGIAGRVYFFNEEAKKAVDANGVIVVQMFDATDPRPGPKTQLGMWHFDPESLKRLKREDVAGPGYTLFLPWEEYNPAVKKVQLQVAYQPARGSPHFTAPQLVPLHPDDAPPPVLIERQITPASHRVPVIR